MMEKPPSGKTKIGAGAMRWVGQKYSPRMAVAGQRVSWVRYSKHWWKSLGRWTLGVGVEHVGYPPPRGLWKTWE